MSEAARELHKFAAFASPAEVRRAEAPGGHKEAHTQMKRYAAAFGSVL